MQKLFRTISIAILILILSASISSAATSKSDLKRMSIFISNFTEQGLYNFDINNDGDDDMIHLADPSNMSELIRFGIAHSIINRPKTILKCTRKNCNYGSSTITGKVVAENVKKYFNMNIKNQSVLDDTPEAFFDGQAYHIEPNEWKPDTIYYADVLDVSTKRGIITMTGELYNIRDKNDRPANFTAEAKPYKWNKKDTWAIISLKVEWR